jgi:hypothetical protein
MKVSPVISPRIYNVILEPELVMPEVGEHANQPMKALTTWPTVGLIAARATAQNLTPVVTVNANAATALPALENNSAAKGSVTPTIYPNAVAVVRMIVLWIMILGIPIVPRVLNALIRKFSCVGAKRIKNVQSSMVDKNPSVVTMLALVFMTISIAAFVVTIVRSMRQIRVV